MTDLDNRVLDILSDNFIGRPVGYFNFNGVSEAIKKIISEEVVKARKDILEEVLCSRELTQVGEVVNTSKVAHILSNVNRGVYRPNRELSKPLSPITKKKESN